MKLVTVQISRASENDPGEVMRGYYTVQDDVVVMLDQDGQPTGTKQKLNGDDEHRIAQRILRKTRPKREGFNRTLRYEKFGVA
jgi:hypothetical protein